VETAELPENQAEKGVRDWRGDGPGGKKCGEERFAVWLLVMAVEFVRGTLRWIFLRPRLGDFRSGQIGVLTGSALFLLIVYFCEPWIRLRRFADGLRVGPLWVVLTLAFEWNFGHYVMGRSWESLAAEYNLVHGE
jgi:hypothetical protein